ncbi:protein fuzzy, partial [Biomphalaria pfeifferi]
LPFPVIGSLNAVHMFSANHDATLQSTTTDDARIVWREFHNSLVLIAVMGRDGASDDAHMGKLLDNVFHAMVLLYGLDDLVNIKNVERFKKEIRICFQLVDILIQQSALTTFSDLTNAVDIMLTPDNAMLQSFLDAFVEAADSPYGCLLANGRVVVATSKWWELSSSELVLLSLLMQSVPQCTSRDIPIYLPQASPSVPHRLMTFELIKNVDVCVICGPSPTLAQLTREIARFWTPAIETLKSTRQLNLRNFPLTLDMDSNVMGFLLVNTKSNRCLSSVNVNREREDTAKFEKRRAVLRSFFKYVVGTYFSNSSIDGTEKGPSEYNHQATDTYIVCSGHKCYAHISGNYQIFLMFSAKIPTFAMRSVCVKTLNLFIKDKSNQI